MLGLFPSSSTAPSYCPQTYTEKKWGQLKPLYPVWSKLRGTNNTENCKLGACSLVYLKSCSPSSKRKSVREVIHCETERRYIVWWKQQLQQPWQEKQQASPHCFVLLKACAYGGLLMCGVGSFDAAGLLHGLQTAKPATGVLNVARNISHHDPRH